MQEMVVTHSAVYSRRRKLQASSLERRIVKQTMICGGAYAPVNPKLNDPLAGQHAESRCWRRKLGVEVILD